MSNNGVPLISGLVVIQNHWKWHHLIDHIRLSISLSCKYSSILYNFIDIWRWKISRPWNLQIRVDRFLLLYTIGLSSFASSWNSYIAQGGALFSPKLFKVIETGTNRKPVCDFLLMFYRNACVLSFQRCNDLLDKNLRFSPFLPTRVSFEVLARGFPRDLG